MRCSILAGCFFAGSAALHIAQSQVAHNKAPRDPQPSPTCTLIEPQPSDTTCEVRGRLHQPIKGYPDQANHQLTPSFSSCRDLVAQTPSYLSLKYNETSRLCTFFTLTVAERAMKFVPNSSSDSVLSDVACYSCPLFSCPSPQGVNLLGNPGFQLSTKYIGPWETESGSTLFPKDIRLVTPGSNSSLALHFGQEIQQETLSQNFYHCKGEVYFFSFDYMVGPSRKRTDNYFTISAGDRNIHLLAEPTNGSWITYQDYFVGGSTQDDFLLLGNFGGGRTLDLYLDNFEIISVSKPLTPKPGAKSLVINSGFETGQLSPWVFRRQNDRHSSEPNETYAIISPGLEGSAYAFQFQNTGASNKYVLEQTLQLIKGMRYLFSMDYSANVTDAESTVYLSFRTGSGSASVTLAYAYHQDSSSNTSLTFPFVAQDDTVALNIHARNDYDDNLTFDNVAVFKLD